MTRTERRERLTISLVISLFVFAALFIATGFSQTTFLPASSAATTIS